MSKRGTEIKKRGTEKVKILLISHFPIIRRYIMVAARNKGIIAYEIA